MTTYNTDNPVPSSHPFDLYDNSKNFDIAMNGRPEETWPDRKGVPRKSWAGIESNVNQFIEDAQKQLARRPFDTLAEAQDDASNNPDHRSDVYLVLNDSDANNGYWKWDESTLQLEPTEIQPATTGQIDSLKVPVNASSDEIKLIRTVTDNTIFGEVPSYIYAIPAATDEATGLAKVLLGILQSGVVHTPKLKADQLDAPGLLTIVPGNDWAWATVGETDGAGNAPVLKGIDSQGRGYAHLPGTGFVKIFDQAQVDLLAAKVGDTSGSPSLSKLVERLFNPLEDCNIVYIGDSTVWGRSASGNSAYGTPTGRRLDDIRNNIIDASFVNRLRTWLGQGFMQIAPDVTATEETAPGAISGGSGYFSDSNQAVEARFSKYVEVLDDQGRVLDKTGISVSGATVNIPLTVPSGCVVRFTVRGAGCTVVHGTSATGGACPVSVDGANYGTLNTSGATAWGAEYPMVLSNAVHVIEISNPSGVDLQIEQIKRTKIIRVVNQGLIGSTSGNWLPTSSYQLINNCLPAAASDAILLIGSNDRLVEGSPLNVWRVKNNHRIIGDYLEAQGVTVTIQSQLGISQDYPDNPSFFFGLQQLDRAKRELCQEKNWSFIERYAASVEKRIDGTWDEGTAPDGGHANDLGHKWAFDDIIHAILKLV